MGRSSRSAQLRVIAIVDVWPPLAEPLKAGIVAMVEALAEIYRPLSSAVDRLHGVPAGLAVPYV